jgi:hypothetical protein
VTVAAVAAAVVAGCGSSETRHTTPPTRTAAATIQSFLEGNPRPLPTDWLGFNGEALTATPGVWRDRRFVAAVAAMHPEAIRLFGGTTANYWDWRRGTFVSAAAARATGIPSELDAARARVKITLRDMAHVVRAAGATPIYDLNVVSSTLAEQLAMLRAARRIGLPVTRVELGNELYMSRYRRVFADGANYGRVASRWAAAIKAAVPGVKVAAVGFVPFGPGALPTARERDWNAEVLATLRGVDALTFHPYFQSGVGAHASLRSTSNVTAMLVHTQARWASVQSQVLSLLPAGMSAWLTEFNLFDRVARAHTTWAQGLALDTFALDALRDSRVDQADVHALVASAPFGALFADRAGLRFGDSASAAFNVPRPHPPATQPFGRSATGVSAAALLSALRGARSVQPLGFRTVAPASVTGAPATALRGAVFFPGDGAARALLLNLSPVALRVRASAAIPNGRFDERWTSPAKLVFGAAALRHASGTIPPDGIVLHAYSVTVWSH